MFAENGKFCPYFTLLGKPFILVLALLWPFSLREAAEILPFLVILAGFAKNDKNRKIEKTGF